MTHVQVVGMFTGGVCLSLMARIAVTMENRTTAKMENRKGSETETFEYLENILSRKRSEAQERGQQWSLDHSTEDHSLRKKGKV